MGDKILITPKGYNIQLEIEYDFIKGEKGLRDDLGQQLEPDVEDAVEIINIKQTAGTLLELMCYTNDLTETKYSESLFKKLEQKILENI